MTKTQTEWLRKNEITHQDGRFFKGNAMLAPCKGGYFLESFDGHEDGDGGELEGLYGSLREGLRALLTFGGE